jgi:D-alanyl-D-alanine carboxypeptidase (penicillin-binding protein 5/6)
MKSFIFRHRRLTAGVSLVALLALLAGVAVLQFNREPPSVTLVRPEIDAPAPPAAAEVAWPESGQASISIAGAGTISESPDQQPRPIASLVKVMTAYLILKHHPLEPGEPGPEVEFNEEHVADYLARSANAESVVPVSAGAKMTQRELLRGLLLASGNNLADVLAEWEAGSVEAFVAQMNAEAKALGMNDTTYADAAGLLPSSVSTAHDQLILAHAAMSDPTFAAIVGEAEAILPGAGVVYNTNSTLGSDGIVGVKTGWTEEAGACFIFAAQSELQGQAVTVIGVVMGQDTLADAFDRSRQLIGIARDNVRVVNVASEGDIVGEIRSGWGSTADAVLTQDVNLLLLPGMELQENVSLVDTVEFAEGDEIGTIQFTAGDQSVEVPLRASASVESPDILWRLTRIR